MLEQDKAGEAMKKGSPRQVGVLAGITRLSEAVDRRIFREVDARAPVKGWQVSSPRPFLRRYRDPRWDLVSVCAECAGRGCPACGGDGRIIADPAGAIESGRAS